MRRKWAVIFSRLLAAWPFDRRDATLAGGLGCLFYGLSLWSAALAFVAVGMVGLAAWAWPLLWRSPRKES